MSKRASIRIPDDLYAQLVERAKEEQRSFSNVIIALLTQALKSQDRAQRAEDKTKGSAV